ncbi:MAG: DUF2085 domain-containing protein [Deltaproteobacteria bacterium]|nr:DUF2085 domain-containing protein [Deltaproteobacteria bacterium]
MSSLDKQGWGILLSHHGTADLHLTYPLRLGRRRLHFCARCVGLYPAMFLVFLGGSLIEPWPWLLEWGLLLIAPLPAMLDWGTSTAAGKPERSNGLRMVTGIGLGLSIGAMLHVNTRDLLGVGVQAQLIFMLGSLWTVWFVSYFRRRRMRQVRVRRSRLSLHEYIAQDAEGPNKKST